MSFTQWDNEDVGTMQAGQIYRASSSDNKVWAEKNLTDSDIQVGRFVAINPEGGIKPIEATTDIVHGIVVKDIYGTIQPNEKTFNIGKFSHGDAVVAVAVDINIPVGSKVYVVATGKSAGTVTTKAVGNLDLGFYVEKSSRYFAAITLGYNQTVGA